VERPFGPGTRAASPGSPWARWLHAVELGGRGRYAAAAAVLGRLLADPAVPRVVAAHAAVALASHRRQQGGHAAARVLDARALALAAAAPDDGDPRPDGTDVLGAVVDALVGLAADAVGLGDAAGAVRLLDAAADRRHPGWRPAVRAGWVRAELALLTGRAGDAVAPAEEALRSARAAGSPRHVLKSRLVRAVVEAVHHPDAVVLAELDALVADAVPRWPPLVWPAQLAGADLAERLSQLSVTESSPAANDSRRRAADASANGRRSDAARRRHAGRLAVNDLYQASDGPGKRLMGESLWVPDRLPVT
jgi:hypothetical protein